MSTEIGNKHPDIILLERRLRQLVMLEEYEMRKGKMVIYRF